MNPIMTPLRQLFATLTGGDAQDQDSGRNAAMINAAVIRALCEPVGAANPCGESVEYDTEYAVLHSRLSPKADVQYGKFSAKPEAPDWLEVERDARRLLLRSKDISILIWLTRARARMAGAGGLLEGLATLHALLLAHPEGIHPRIVIDGQADPAVRANALAALCDPEGLLGDVRDIVVSASTAFRLTVRDAERAFVVPRNPYAVDPENIKRQLADLYAKRDETLLALLCCSVCVEDIALWEKAALQEEAPDLSPLHKLLACLASFNEPVSATPKVHAQALEAPMPTVYSQPLAHAEVIVPVSGSSVAEQREQVRQMLRQVRQWIDQHEPSSPVSVLLRQADRMWGKRFSEVASMIPPDLLQAWDRED